MRVLVRASVKEWVDSTYNLYAFLFRFHWNLYVFYNTEIYPYRWQWWKNRSVFSRSQSWTRTMKFHWWKIIVRGLWLDERCFSLMKSDRTASHVILGAKTGKPPFYFQDVGKVCGRRFSWQFYCRTRKQSHITKNTTRCKTFANLFRKQEWYWYCNQDVLVRKSQSSDFSIYFWITAIYGFVQRGCHWRGQFFNQHKHS